jgi:tetratricopeptide (TPR) repeat protein
LSGSYFELPAAVDAFRSAIEIDPTYAPAHAGLARARCLQAVFRAVPHQEAFTEAKASALRALAMDSASADAQVALGTVLFLSEWDWTAAERSLCRALEINPDHTEALLQYGSLQEALGRLDDGLRCKQQALARDPRSPGVLLQIAISYWHQRKYDETQVWARRALEIDPKHVLASQFITHVYWKIGDVDRFAAWIVSQAIVWGFSEERSGGDEAGHRGHAAGVRDGRPLRGEKIHGGSDHEPATGLRRLAEDGILSRRSVWGSRPAR